MPHKTLSHLDIAKMIDISAVQAYHGEQEIRELVSHAAEYGFGSVHVLPAWVPFARELLAVVDGIVLGAPVGFPSGGNHTAIKRAEALQAVEDGVDELDMMMNVGKLRSRDYRYVLEDIRSVVGAVEVPVKVILETHYLTDDEIGKACELCIEAQAAYVKTATGWAETGATLDNVALLTSCANGQIGVKAAGGIRDLDTLVAMYRLGARRFGINVRASVDIIDECKQWPQGTIRVDS